MDIQGSRALAVRRPGPIAAIAAGAAGLAGLAAIALGLDAASPLKLAALVIAVAAAIVWVPAALTRPVLAVPALIVVDIANLGSVINVGPVTLYLVSLAIAIASVAFAIARGTLRPAWSCTFLFALVYLAWQALDALLVAPSGPTLGVVTGMARDYVFFGVVAIWLCSSRRNLYIGAATVVVTLAALCGLSLAQELLFHNSTSFGGLSQVAAGSEPGVVGARHTGPQSDANFWARSLLMFLPVALSLFAVDAGRRRRRLWIACTLLICGGIFLTSSRGGLIATGCAVLVWAAIAGRQYRRLLLLAPLAGIGLFLVPGVGPRLMTLSQLGTQAVSAGKDTSLTGREDAQRVGLSIFLDHPLLGVGPGGFDRARVAVERDIGIVTPTTTGVHNLYLEIGLETGAVGLVLWTLFFGSAMFVAARAMLRARRTRDGPMWELNLMAAGAFAGLLGFGIASVVLHAAYLRFLYVLVGMAVATDLLTCKHTTEPRDGEWREPATTPASARAEAAGWLAGVTAFVLLCIPATILSLQPRWVGTAEAIVTPTPQPGDAQVFPNLELVYTRVLPNLASLARSRPSTAAALRGLPDPSARVSAFRPLGTTALKVETVSTDSATARVASERVLERTVSSRELYGVLFEATPLEAGRAQVQRQLQVDALRLLTALAIAFALAVGVAVLTFAFVRRRHRET